MHKFIAIVLWQWHTQRRGTHKIDVVVVVVVRGVVFSAGQGSPSPADLVSRSVIGDQSSLWYLLYDDMPYTILYRQEADR